ncbi:GAF domain-containing protein [Parasphingorhabdus sp.]|uniref:GAF domain-containing protein n=1 Tax=Parasphingorhabdus sp. TaxID=2709688 RepID=UPI003D2AF121
MHDVSIQASSAEDGFYDDLSSAARALVNGEPDPIANMANIAALIWQYVPNLNWAGFYRVIEGELVLGPFQGKTACIRIAMGKGVCGTAVETGTTQRVADVHAFPGHIACDADSRSELVVPVFVNGVVIAVLDLDSPTANRFTQDDEDGFVKLIGKIANSLG